MAQWMIGETYMHQDDVDLALSAYLRVETLHDWPEWSAAGLLQAAKCYQQMNRWRPAAETLTRLVEKYPTTRFVKDARERLATLPTQSGLQVASQSGQDRI